MQYVSGIALRLSPGFSAKNPALSDSDVPTAAYYHHPRQMRAALKTLAREERMLIGRDPLSSKLGETPQAYFKLAADGHVSRAHAVMRRGSDDKLRLSDLGSNNGTWYRVPKGKSIVLESGDQFQVGSYRFKAP